MTTYKRPPWAQDSTTSTTEIPLPSDLVIQLGSASDEAGDTTYAMYARYYMSTETLWTALHSHPVSYWSITWWSVERGEADERSFAGVNIPYHAMEMGEEWYIDGEMVWKKVMAK